MHLGLLEKLYITSPLRRCQLAWDMRRLQALAPIPPKSHVLDLGCGPGHGLLYARQHLQPATLTGVDADPRQIARARAAANAHNLAVQLHMADATALPLPAATYDIVLSLGCLHHVPDWPQALAECARVLRHGGLLYLHEYYRPLLHNPLMKLLAPHPANRFTHAQLLAELPRHGFTLIAHKNYGLAGDVVARHTSNPLPYE